MMENISAKKVPLKLLDNRVYRTYKGGKLIDHWRGKAAATDSLQPEIWVASLVAARNSQWIKDEGLSLVEFEGEQFRLIDLINSDSAFFLGQDHVGRFGSEMGVLTKVLDAAVRLSIQVHPTKAYSRKFFKSEFGKTEAWYILGGREEQGERPYVLAGFKPGITKKMWKTYFEEQNIDAMINALHKFEVKEGDVVLIEGGLPHAIGSGCFLIEIQEPTDFTMRIERVAFDGTILPDAMCHQGVGFDNMLDCFVYENLSYEETYQKCFKKPAVVYEHGNNRIIALISEKDTPCFGMNKLVVANYLTINDHPFKACIVLKGKGRLEANGSDLPLRQGDMYFLPAGLSPVKFTNVGECNLECILCYPPA